MAIDYPDTTFTDVSITGTLAGEAVDRWGASRGMASATPYYCSIGDSIAGPDYNNANKVTPTSNTSYLINANGYVGWMLFLTGQRVRCPVETNVWSFPSQRTGVILANLPAFIAQQPRVPSVIDIHCGTNNIHNMVADGFTPDQVFQTVTGDFQSMVAIANGISARVMLSPILPRSASWTTDQFDCLNRVNQWINNFSQRSRGIVAVPSSALVNFTDPAAAGVVPKALKTYDGTHPATAGSFDMGEARAAILNTWFPPLDLLPYSNLAFSALSPYSNVLTNGMMLNSGGTVTTPRTIVAAVSTSGSPNLTGLTGTAYPGDFVTGTGIPAGTTILTGGASTAVMTANATTNGTPNISAIGGTAPDNWIASMTNNAGLTVANSQVTSAISGQPMHQMVFGGSYTIAGAAFPNDTLAVYGRLQQNISAGAGSFPASLVAGDKIEALIAVEIDASNNAICFPSLQMRWKGSSNVNIDKNGGAGTCGGEIPSKQIVGVLRTPAHTYIGSELPLVSNDIVFDARMHLRSRTGTWTPAATARFGRAIIQKVVE